MTPLKNKRILVLGGTGAFGKAFLRHLATADPQSVIVISRDEMKHAALKRAIGTEQSYKLTCCIADICRPETFADFANDVDIVVHAAAMKHLPECEANPIASCDVNVQGTINAIRFFQRSSANTFIFLSTDKAPAASSVYGAQKYIGEKLTIATNDQRLSDKKAIVMRYSNVVDSTGSAFLIFGDIFKAGKCATVNGAATVRGFVTQSQVINVLETIAGEFKGGETFVMTPKVIRIAELAQAMCQLIGKGDVEVKDSSSFAGEKETATLVMKEEMKFARSLPGLDGVLLDNLNRHPELQKSLLAHDSWELEHCEALSGPALVDFLKPVMAANGML